MKNGRSWFAGIATVVALLSSSLAAADWTPYRGQVFRTQVAGRVRVVAGMVDSDWVRVQKAACLAQKLYPQGSLSLPPRGATWGAVFENADIQGLTYWPKRSVADVLHRRAPMPHVFIAVSQFQGLDDSFGLVPWVRLGSTVVHEADHYYHDTVDPEVGHRIDDRIEDNFAEAMRIRDSGVCQLPDGLSWRYQNTAERLACECGISLFANPKRRLD